MAKQPHTPESSWATEEFATVALQDRRLDQRCQVVAEALEQQPTRLINQACEDWADAKAAYRFMDNPKVSPARLLAPHVHRTVTRLSAYPVVLAVQDTTYLNYTSHPQTTGLGPIASKAGHRQGFLMHTTLALTPQGLPLGLLTHSFLIRPVDEPAHTSTRDGYLPLQDKESYRWVEAFTQTLALTAETPTRIITVCDREADLYEMFTLAVARQAGLGVRARFDRLLAEPNIKFLWAKVERQRRAGELTVDITGNQHQASRQATVSLRACTVTLRPPRRPPPQKLSPLKLTAILVREIHPPAGLDEPIEWLLLTNTPVATLEDMLGVIQWYACRWQIEVYHKILKSGCAVEAARLQTASRLQNYIAVMSVVAWRLHWLTYLNRTEPDQPCTLVLSTAEWQALYLRIHKTMAFPKKLPTVRQSVRWIAQLGGFLGRKSDGEPGVTVIWRGWQRLQDMAATWSVIVNEQPKLMGNR